MGLQYIRNSYAVRSGTMNFVFLRKRHFNSP